MAHTLQQPTHFTPNLPTNIVDFGGLDSSIMLVGVMLVGVQPARIALSYAEPLRRPHHQHDVVLLVGLRRKGSRQFRAVTPKVLLTGCSY